MDALDCRYISQADLDNFSENVEIIGRLLSGYISFLRTKIWQHFLNPSTHQLINTSGIRLIILIHPPKGPLLQTINIIIR